MALGIKKITESVIEDGRSLTITGPLNNDKIKERLKKSRLINYIYETKDELSAIRILNLR